MNADRQTGFDRRLEDRPISSLAQKLAGAAQEQNMGKAAIAGALANLQAGQLAILVRDDDRRLEPRIASVPTFQLVFIGSKRHRGAELIVLLALSGGRERVHDAPLDPVEVEMLLAHEIEVARG